MTSLFFTRLECLKIESKFDKEYQTQWLSEVNYLRDHGIRYSFVKDLNGISTYKYKKTVMLFRTLADFYETIYYKE